MSGRAGGARRGAARFVLAAALAALPPASPGAGAAPPRIAFDSEVCDVGSVVQGEQPSCDFTFANGGGGELRIHEVVPSCGCTTALLSAPAVTAGARGSLRVVFDSREFAGEVVKEIEVRTNDPVRPVVTLRLEALVEPEIDFEPRLVTIDGPRTEAVASRVVMITNRMAGPARLVRLGSLPDSCSCRVPAWPDPAQPFALEPWDRVALEVTLATPQPMTMPVAGECLLEIEGPRKRTFVLKVLALPPP